MQGSTLIVALAAIAALSAFAPPATAHIALLSPKPRSAELKDGPCGAGPSETRTTGVTTFRSGQKITVTWKETIGHPGHYRISFDPNGVGAFVDPKSFTDLDTAPSVLLDNIADKSGTQSYSQEVTLPDVECDKCTLQLIQVMTDKPPYGDGNDLYYQCADIVLARDAAPVGSDDAGAGTSSGAPSPPAPKDEGSCATRSGPVGSGSIAVLAAASALAILTRRRRRR